ncbi:MAG TPA: hypothetical protein VJ552_05885 [Sediminibacterium sp.]|nr:hypothetical protein [Sediminibacterium sp.]
MLGLLDSTEEYNNQGGLLGVDMLENPELMGMLGRMNPIKRQRTINRLTGTGIPSKGSRAEMEKFFSELPQNIKDGLKKGELRLADTVIYSIKPATTTTIKMFETQDDKDTGLRNISSAKLPKNQAMLVSGIYMLAGTGTDSTKPKVLSADYIGLENFNAIANGEFTLVSNRKQIVPPTSNSVFKTNSYHSVPSGYYKLANPRLIHDDIQIEFTIEMGSLDGIAAHTHIYVGLHGTITTP